MDSFYCRKNCAPDGAFAGGAPAVPANLLIGEARTSLALSAIIFEIFNSTGKLLMEKPSPFLGRKAAWLALVVITVVAFAVVAAPVWIIQPFQPQTARGVAVSYTLRRWSPWITVLSLASAVFLVAQLWTGSRWWKRAFLVIVFIPLLASTWFARQNHFEWMFNPLANATYAKSSEAGFVADTDIVMTVESNGEAAAYPIRQMAYHHLVQDVVGGTPIVATY